ncbi:hypothetical protein JW960_20340 [candidate division KSB1 bacterium]|nr:hypothetical protein [candidate division KSB1 bacterium]
MKKLNISQVDTIFANGSYPIEFIMYYKNRLNTKAIRSALRKLSGLFWPMFGKYDAGVIQFDRYNETACFAEVHIQQIFQTHDSNENIYQTYCSMIPADMESLFFLKVIQLNNGTVLIPKLNHLAGDGFSYFFMLGILAMISRNYLLRQVIRAMLNVNHKRTILKAFHFDTRPAPCPAVPDKLSISFEQIPKAEVRAQIKQIAAANGQSVSTNDILSAIVLKRTVELQKKQFDKNILLTMPVDVRRKIPQYGQRFIGNGLMFNDVNFETAMVNQSEIHDIAIEIRKHMPDVTPKYYLDYLAHIETLIADARYDKLKPYDPDKGCLVTNLSRLPATKLNFGTGIPDFIFPLTVGKNSAAVLADSENFILRLVF